MFMRLFLNWLIGKENEWYLLQLTQVMTNWNILEEKFISWFFPQNKFMEAKTTIVVFSQGSTKTLCEKWERYIYMLKRCINHGFYDLIQISIFRNRLQQLPKLLLDATTDGSLMSKSVEDIIVIIKKWHSMTTRGSAIGIHHKGRLESLG